VSIPKHITLLIELYWWNPKHKPTCHTEK
jgi:hypothetical protein